jgi:hypothetical protein
MMKGGWKTVILIAAGDEEQPSLPWTQSLRAVEHPEVPLTFPDWEAQSTVHRR